jgi:glycerol-3-phosphate acyltransferase PlsY
MTSISALGLILLAYLCGSLPFSVWLGKLFQGLDVRQFGDGNPGATNAFRAGSPVLGVISLFLDVGKAALPVGMCYFTLGLRGLPMLAISLAPLLGHMFSPFLGFKGGKALAAALGTWIGLSTWQVSLPAVLGVLVGTAFFTQSGWAVVFALGIIALSLVGWHSQPLFFWVWAGQLILLIWTHREQLKSPPRMRSWLKKLFCKRDRNARHG